MNKAFILTNISLSDNDICLLKNSNILKIALNQHADNLNPDFRICSDYIIGHLLKAFSQKIITIKDWVPDDRLIYAGHIRFKGSTIVACIEYLISENYDSILIIGDNTVHSEIFQNRVNQEIDLIVQNNPSLNIFQFQNGNFNLPVKNIFDFINY